MAAPLTTREILQGLEQAPEADPGPTTTFSQVFEEARGYTHEHSPQWIAAMLFWLVVGALAGLLRIAFRALRALFWAPASTPRPTIRPARLTPRQQEILEFQAVLEAAPRAPRIHAPRPWDPTWCEQVDAAYEGYVPTPDEIA